MYSNLNSTSDTDNEYYYIIKRIQINCSFKQFSLSVFYLFKRHPHPATSTIPLSHAPQQKSKPPQPTTLFDELNSRASTQFSDCSTLDSKVHLTFES